jgi:hypothetical protein
LGAASHIQFTKEVAEMHFNCAKGDKYNLGEFTILKSPAYVPQDF